ncbi:MAG: hypothetical protein GKS04_03075 [Candidatus Mycalebacterium zealandia]|nr:MAG: hypothetical protein GKS04_03075 [Candidatus Mycalebacterium zealandia]
MNAEQALKGQRIPVQRWGVNELRESPIEWGNIKEPEKTTRKRKKKLLAHQKDALKNVSKGFKKADRGKLIMACRTGKTLTSLKIAEEIVPENGNILFLVPSISLLSQALREWSFETDRGQRNFAVCSDTKVGEKGNIEGINPYDLAFPTTDHNILAQNLKQKAHGRTNIFSTYHSIEIVAKAQELGAPQFDLVICDEAHRTTGVEKEGF